MNIFRFQKLVILNKVKDLREVRDCSPEPALSTKPRSFAPAQDDTCEVDQNDTSY